MRQPRDFKERTDKTDCSIVSKGERYYMLWELCLYQPSNPITKHVVRMERLIAESRPTPLAAAHGLRQRSVQNRPSHCPWIPLAELGARRPRLLPEDHSECTFLRLHPALLLPGPSHSLQFPRRIPAGLLNQTVDFTSSEETFAVGERERGQPEFPRLDAMRRLHCPRW